MHHWVPVTTQGGYVLAGTYNPTSAGDKKAPAAWRPANLDPALAHLIADHPHAGEIQIGNLLEARATRYIADHPAYVAKVAYQNSLRLFDLSGLGFSRVATFEEYGYEAPWGTLEAVSGVAMLVLALIGFGLRRGRRVPAAYLAIPVVLYVSTVALQAVPRFRSEIDPFLLQLSAVTIVTVMGTVRRRPTRLRSLRAPTSA